MAGKNHPAGVVRSEISRSCRSTQGLTLLELLIAFLILQIAITGFAQLFMGGLDLSRRTRISELAQILAQDKMEELVRTLPADIPSVSSKGSAPFLLRERPAPFSDFGPASAAEVNSFRWIAEAAPAPHDPKLIYISLYVYTVSARPAKRESVEPGQEFYLSDDRTRFVYFQTAADGSTEVIQGKENLRLATAVAVP